MTNSRTHHLSDIKNALSLIEEFSVDVHTFSRYATDAKTKSAVERQLGIIGTAISRLNREDATPLPQAQQWINLANQIHACDPIDDNMVWIFLRTAMPALKSEVTARLTV
jgi:uncharacterized protein with HEPN domain